MNMRTIHILLLASLGCHASAATYYVSTNGNDANSGLSVPDAFATIQHAAYVASAGDSVVVQPGDHAGFAAMDHSGTAGQPIVFIGAAPGVNIVSPCSYNNLDGINVENVAWIVIEGFTVSDMPRTGIRNVLTDHVTIRYNSCHSNYKWGILCGFAEHTIIEHNSCSGSEDEHGIYFSNSADDPIIRYNHCFDNYANGIHMNGDASLGGDGIISNAQVYGNTIHGNGAGGGSGINCDGVVNSAIFNNLLYDNHASGISLYRIDGGAPSTDNKVWNNTIINAADARWCVNITDGCTGNSVLNNILINLHPWRGSIVIAADALDGFTSDHNLVVESLSADGDATILDLAAWQALGYDGNSQVADAMNLLFTAPGSGDFHALNAACQQVNAGTSAVSSIVAEDLDLTARPVDGAFDIGCYEFNADTGIPALPSTTDPITLGPDGIRIPSAPPGSILRVFDPAGRLLSENAIRSGSIPMHGTGPVLVVLYEPCGRQLRAQWIMFP